MPSQTLEQFERRIRLFEQVIGRNIEKRVRLIEEKFEQKVELPFRRFEQKIGRNIESRFRRLTKKRQPFDEVRFLRSWIEKPLSMGPSPVQQGAGAQYGAYVDPDDECPVIELGPARAGDRRWSSTASIRRGSSGRVQPGFASFAQAFPAGARRARRRLSLRDTLSNYTRHEAARSYPACR